MCNVMCVCLRWLLCVIFCVSLWAGWWVAYCMCLFELIDICVMYAFFLCLTWEYTIHDYCLLCHVPGRDTGWSGSSKWIWERENRGQLSGSIMWEGLLAHENKLTLSNIHYTYFTLLHAYLSRLTFYNSPPLNLTVSTKPSLYLFRLFYDTTLSLFSSLNTKRHHFTYTNSVFSIGASPHFTFFGQTVKSFIFKGSTYCNACHLFICFCVIRVCFMFCVFMLMKTCHSNFINVLPLIVFHKVDL